MHQAYRIGIVLACGLAGLASAATVTFDVRPADETAGDEVVVFPGDEVEYVVTALVESATTTADNQGLALFTLTIHTGLGLQQNPADAFEDFVLTDFTFGQSLGTVDGDRIVGIGASQFGLGSALLTGVGVGAPRVLVRGRFLTPTTEGTFTPVIEDGSFASIVALNGTSTGSATAVAGAGFTIRTSTTGDGDDTGDGGDTGDGDDADDGDDTDNGTTPIDDGGLSAVEVGALIVGGAILATIGAFALSSTLGLLILLIVIPLLGTLGLLGLGG